MKPGIRWISTLLLATLLAASPCALAQAARKTKTAAPAGEEALPIVSRKFTGDFDAMVKRRMIRVLVVSSKTFYFVDKGTQRGVTYDAFRLFENDLNKSPKHGKIGVHVVFVPVRRDQLIPALLDGRGDIAAANLGVTAEREEQIEFSSPTRSDRDEIVVTGPRSQPITTLDELSGREVYVRKSSSYYENLELLNARFAKEGKKPVRLRLAPEELQDDDLLEMLNSGLVNLVIVDGLVGKFWSQIFPNIRLHPDVAIVKNEATAWMMRRNDPKLKKVINAFLARYPEGSAQRNMLFQKYLKSTKWVKNATSAEELEKFQRTVELFRKYGEKYDLDYLFIMAQGYQESQLDQAARSQVGAVGIMQVMPATGKDMGVGDIHQLEPNIHAGVKYIRFMVDRYYADEPMDKIDKALFAFASYNAGPARVAELRRAAAKRGLDPNVWFNNVEVIASEKIGRETVQYVSNIYKYYVAYKLITEDEEERRKALEEVEKKAS
jgi:membrane-bound lytic murein transglycosylase MltF